MNSIYLKKFSQDDIEFKVNLINDSNNNKYLHYDLPLTIDKTKLWFENNKDKTNRYDCTIFQNEVRVGIIGVLNIQDGKGEYYITLSKRGNGIAVESTNILFDIAKKELGMSELYLFTEENNKIAQNFFEKVGFGNKKLIKYNDSGKETNRYYYDRRL